MGYIAPVTQFDYIQYANRTVEAAEKVRIVKGAAPIQPIRFNQVLERESVEGLHQIQDNDRVSAYGAGTYQYEMGMSVSKDLTAGMTGKGRFINEIV
ncbi:hypothetical protein QRD90_06530 [Peribacillus frigoritolerans]|jgi:hypothetical protein|uniref:hypothetical protein n=1 Tax=Peribacillus TaxID=2675229 RepID=UPI0006AC8758|nr:hypothetical protein [Peribacillus frigoritolerans]KOR77874.1 hypothetical protein AM232_04840 [Bacillus sp. FJAT-21352]AZV60845.1 hypothetical protein DOZ91_09590 [Peribacillus frigoritolerans]USK81578.1 hypothetical protein LHV56_06525 [Peribacillus frigoritolerans]WHX63232.1 hypothetical protein QNH33_06555 [Peribacillus frigoritolerans]WJE48859.1 hypothetical protein QRD90_06530 [Peribacillus frigoritolerans]